MYFVKSGCIRAKDVVFGQKMLYSGILVVFWQGGFNRARWLFSGKVVVIEQIGLYSCKSGLIHTKWLY